MSKDYASKTRQRSAKGRTPSPKRTSRRHKSNGRRVFLSCLGLGWVLIIVIVLFLFYKRHGQIHGSVLPTTSLPTVSAAIPHQQQAKVFSALSSKPPTPPVEIERRPRPPAKLSRPSQYRLIIAMDSQRDQIEAMRERLLRLGFHAHIESIEHAGHLGYRLQMGPYSSPARVESDQTRLQQHNIVTVMDAQALSVNLH